MDQSGGGAIQLTVSGTTTLNGTISAQGQGGGYASCGSGGSIYLTTANLTGAGTISANGGSNTGGGNNYPGGGGGRIAIILTSGTTFGSVAMTAYGGTEKPVATKGGAGTIYKKDASNNEILLIDNKDQDTTATTEIPSGQNWNFITGSEVITVQNYGKLGIASGATLTVDNISNFSFEDTSCGLVVNGTLAFNDSVSTFKPGCTLEDNGTITNLANPLTISSCYYINNFTNLDNKTLTIGNGGTVESRKW